MLVAPWKQAATSAAALANAWALAPTRLMAVVAVLSLALSLLCLAVAVDRPWLGLRLAVEDGKSASLRVARAAGPSQTLGAGTRLVALETQNDMLALRAGDLAAEPDASFAPYPEFDAFMQRQDAIAQKTAQPAVALHTEQGQVVELRPATHRPLGDLPWPFWFQLFCGQSSFVVGGALWAFRRSDPAAGFAMLAGIGAMLAASAAAIYSTRELALPATLFKSISALNHLGTSVCCAGFVCVMFFYPRPLWPGVRPGRILLPLCLGLWLLEQLRVLPTGMASMNLLIALGYLVSLGLAAVQWWRVRGDLRSRIAFQWFLLSWFFGSGVLIFVVLVPVLAGYDTGDMQAYGFGALFVTQVGVVLGVARYRLFELETWWFRAVLLVGGAFAVLLLDVLFTSVLSYGRSLSLTLSLLAAGWLYFPARQWLSRRIFYGTRRVEVEDVPELLREVLVSATVPATQLLPLTLRRLFTPLHLQALSARLDQVRLADDGLALQVPGVGGAGAWVLRYADDGRRLFNRRDLTLASAVRAVLERFADYQMSVAGGVERERSRVAQDLHDDVGARLLTLLHRSDDEAGATIREVIDSLRHTVYSLGAEPRSLADTLASLRAESAERCEAAGANLVWIQPAPLPERLLDAAQQQDLLRVLREALSNALRHARPTHIGLTVSATNDVLSVQLEHDGAASPPQQWRAGTGLRGMHARAQRLGGRIDLDGTGNQVRVRLEIPIPGTLPPSAGQTAAEDRITMQP